jgi:hypothetical protein
MDEAGQLIETFRARSTSSVRSKLDALMDLERLRDPRVVPFLLGVLADRREPTPVRIHVLKRLRNGNLLPAHRPVVAVAMLRVLSDRSSPDMRVHAALALAEFTEVDGVPTRLGRLALDPDEPIELRFSAFTSLQRAGPTRECVALLRQLLGDEALGRSARSVLSLWRLE